MGEGWVACIQSSEQKFRTINTRVHVRTTSAITARGKKIAFTTMNFVPWYSGSTKLEVWPGGGLMAGIGWASAMVHRVKPGMQDKKEKNNNDQKRPGEVQTKQRENKVVKKEPREQ